MFVAHFQYDAVTALMNAVRKTAEGSSLIGQLLTAATLAGGSSGVNTLLVALGFREVRTPKTEAPTVASDRAWVAIKVIQERSVGQVMVKIGAPIAGKAEPDADLPLAGLISGGVHGSGSAFRRFFLRDLNRFPPYGGYQVPAAEACRIVLRAQAASGDEVISVPIDFIPAQRAIIDLTIRL
jgi:hypothetical protein